MKKALRRFILLLAVIAISAPAFSALVSQATAQNAAVNFFKTSAANTGHNAINVTLKYTQTATDGTIVFYVFDLTPGPGFVMISADDQVKPVIAYSLESGFNLPAKGTAVQTWITHATAHIYRGIQQHVVANAQISGQWTAYLQGQKPSSAKGLSGVAPLLTTKWDQEPYYNQLCPFNTTDNERAVTGCSATAMAQIMKFWNFPPQGVGYYGYNCSPSAGYPNNYGSQAANFGATNYNWSAMPDSLGSANTVVATLMYHCGVAVSMQYGDDNQGGSGSYLLRSDVSSTRHSAEMAYSTYFNYNPNTLNGVHETNFTSADWLNMIEAELNAGRPIQYAGTDPNEGGHTWVCDGYDANDLLHMNWGWGGFDNGYYSISALTGDNYNFSTKEEALLGIQPMSDLSVTASASGTSVCSGGTVTLTATGTPGVSYSWSPAAGLSCATCATTIASPTTATTYTVTIDSAGLSATAQVTVNMMSNSVTISSVDITNVTQNGVANGSASVKVTGGTPAYSYLWNNEATTDTIINLAPGNYVVTATDLNGCSASASANITQPDTGSVVVPSGQSEGTAREGSVRSTNAVFINQGSNIYVQKSALVEVQGDFVNTPNTTSGSINNDGVIELSGNFENDSGAVFQVGTNSASTDRAVKFIGSGKQTIIGAMSTKGSASFYNLVVDQASASDTVEMQTPLVVEGSLAFGTASVTTTYNPSSLYTNNNQKGLFKTFTSTGGEYLLDIQNGNTDAISGYPVLEIGGAPSTGYILTSGIRGSSAGGVQRAITSATSYLYPVGTPDKGFNAAKLNFSEIPGSGSVKVKFCSGSSDASGYVGSLATSCSGCSSENPAPADSGYNRYFPSNECNNGAPQWLILDHTSHNHGYWSLDATTNTGYKYDMEVYPNNFAAVDASAAWRLLKHEASYGADPSLHSTNWTPEIESTVSSITDLLTYTKNIGCYQGAGVPGGSYSNFSHFTMGMGGVGQALPVQLISLSATPMGKHHVTVAWATALEINNAGFFVMRSTDGVSFADVGWVVGHDNSTVTNNYTFDDRVPQNTLYYYKLRQVDNNGKFVYTYIVQANLSDQTNTDFALYPNPTNSEIFLDVKNAADEVKVDMYDISGQLVYNNIFTIATAGTNQTLTIQASSMLPPGTYILNATMNEEKYSAKVILQ